MAKEARIKKRKVILFIIIIVTILAIISGILTLVHYFKNKNKVTETDEQSNAIELPDTTYSDMKVTDVEMEFLKENNETMVSMVIQNTSNNKVEKESVDALLIDKDGKTLGQTQTYIEHLEPKEEYRISVILKGDLTATTSIKLQKVK